jgi:membrane associated rhomboid family serine protease
MSGMGYATQPTAPKKPSAWKVAGVTIVTFVALLYLIEAWDAIHHQYLDGDGIRPLEWDGLSGIFWAPLLHGGWPHLWANTIPALVLGFLVALNGLGKFLGATAIVWLVGGLGTWLIGDVGPCPDGIPHIGASGLIFGWFTFLLVFGWLVRKPWQIVVSIAVFLYYGGLLWSALPSLNSCTLVSWQGHLCGAVAGVVAAYLLSGPERKAREARTRGASLPQTFGT